MEEKNKEMKDGWRVLHSPVPLLKGYPWSSKNLLYSNNNAQIVSPKP